MRIRTLVWREMFERKNQLLTSFLAILLGITVIVSIKNITFYSEKAVARELDALGANILILPKSAFLQDYYSADLQAGELPEEYVSLLTNSNLQGLDNLSPKLSVPAIVQGKNITLTGILPKNEFQAKATWQGAGIFAKPQGCGTVANIPGITTAPPQETLVRKRVIDSLGDNEALVGADVAAALNLKAGEQVELMGKPFNVTAILPQTGTVDDSRIFAHLHTVQQLAGKGAVVNAIEIVGCCSEISKGLVNKINHLLPDAKVVTVTQVVDTQVKTNAIMSRLSLLFLAIMILVGGASMANYMYANVYERRKEIGTLMAMGATSGTVSQLFLMKALLLGLAGGVGGYISGTILAMIAGPKLAGVSVLPMPVLALWAMGISVAIALAASIFPVRRATRLDPCTALMEV